MIDKRYTMTQRPISGAMNLSDGKPDAKQAFFTAGFTFASLLVMAIGALVALWSIPSGFDARWNVARVIGIITGASIAIFAFVYAFTMGNITVSLWQGYLKRLDAWHNAELTMYLDQRGSETTHEYSQLELTPEVASHVLITALAIQYQLSRQTKYRHAPWSVRGLEEKLYLAGASNSVLLGELTGTRPELMSARLAQLGLVVGRKEGYAGEWSAQSYEEIFITIAKNWGKIR